MTQRTKRRDTLIAISLRREAGEWCDGPEEARCARAGQANRTVRIIAATPLPRPGRLHIGGWRKQEPESRPRLAYRLVQDDYRDGGAIQLIVEHSEAL